MNSFTLPYKKFFPVLVLSMSVLLSSCGGSDSQTNDQQSNSPSTALTKTAVVATAASDYSSGAHSIVSYSKPRVATNDLLSTGSDLRMSAYEKYFYRIEDSNSQSVTKFSIDDPSTPIWQFSTEGTETNSYPYNIVFVSETKAYLIRNGSPKVWIINPSATVESQFKIGEIDLSAYNNCDGLPEATSGLLVGNKLFITLQRLCNWQPTDSAYIAVFDTDTNQEINTGMGEGGLLGIKLDVRNPGGTYGKIRYYDGYIYAGGADGLYGNANAPVMGGIQRINVSDYTKSAVLEPSRQITSIDVVSDTKGYFVQYNAWGNNSLVSFNPQTWAILSENVAGIGISGDRNITDITKDYDGYLWVADSSVTNPGIYVVNTSTDTIDEGPISTDLNPLEISFCEE